MEGIHINFMSITNVILSGLYPINISENRLKHLIDNGSLLITIVHSQSFIEYLP
jgi:hypothetical protein